jgi:protein transport protein SEC23
MTYVHELGFAECPKAYVFRGDKELTSRQVQDQLGLTLTTDPLNKGDNSALKRFLVPVSECEFALNSILDDLQPDPWPVKTGNRPSRCVGTALNVAIALLEAAGGASRGSRIVTLVGGAATYGPGMIVSEELKEKIRSHLDIQKERDNTKYLKKALKYYQDLSLRA